MVLGRGSNHRWPTDVYVLDSLIERDVGPGDRCLERVKVAADDVDRLDGVDGKGLHVGRYVTAREDPGVNHRVKGFDPPIQHFREARDIFDASDRHTSRLNDREGSTGRNQFIA